MNRLASVDLIAQSVVWVSILPWAVGGGGGKQPLRLICAIHVAKLIKPADQLSLSQYQAGRLLQLTQLSRSVFASASSSAASGGNTAVTFALFWLHHNPKENTARCQWGKSVETNIWHILKMDFAHESQYWFIICCKLCIEFLNQSSKSWNFHLIIDNDMICLETGLEKHKTWD